MGRGKAGDKHSRSFNFETTRNNNGFRGGRHFWTLKEPQLDSVEKDIISRLKYLFLSCKRVARHMSGQFFCRQPTGAGGIKCRQKNWSSPGCNKAVCTHRDNILKDCSRAIEGSRLRPIRQEERGRECHRSAEWHHPAHLHRPDHRQVRQQPGHELGQDRPTGTGGRPAGGRRPEHHAPHVAGGHPAADGRHRPHPPRAPRLQI